MELVSFNALDGLRLKGLLALSEANLVTVIHIHGNFGNFYENEFIPIMIDRYPAAGINFLCVNNRGHDGIAEAYKDGKLVYIGGAYEMPDEHCILDIEGAVRYAERLGGRIVLQGHSFGCLKTLAYLLRTERALDFILLSPSDTYRLQTNYIYPETVHHQLSRILADYSQNLDALLPRGEFGIKQHNTEYHIPISARTFVSIFGGSLTDLLNYDKSYYYHLNTRGFVYFGGQDDLRTQSRSQTEDFFHRRILDLHFCYREGGDHHFRQLETDIVDEIVSWIRVNSRRQI